MGTRGFVGFVVDGIEKISYNHFDSYPGGLGVEVLRWLRDADLADVTERVRQLRVVDPTSKPTVADIDRLSRYANRNVGTQELDAWYVLLRKTQGNPAAILEAGVMEDAGNFPLDSLFAEYGYLIDLDAQSFEVYVGFQKAPHDKGRFAKREHANGDDYHPCALFASWPLARLPGDSEFLAALSDGDE